MDLDANYTKGDGVSKAATSRKRRNGFAGRRPEKSRALARQSRTNRSLRHRLDVVGDQLALALARAHKAEEDNASLRKLVVDLMGDIPVLEEDLAHFLDAEEK